MFDDTCFKQIRKCEVQGRESPHGRGGRACLRGGGGGLCRCPANRAGRAVGRLCRGLSVLEGRVRLCRRGPPAHSPARSPARPPTRPFARPFAHSPAPPIQSSVRHGPCRRIHRPLPLRSPQTSSPVFLSSKRKELNEMSLLNLFKPARLLIPDVPAPTSRVPFSCVLIGVLMAVKRRRIGARFFTHRSRLSCPRRRLYGPR